MPNQAQPIWGIRIEVPFDSIKLIQRGSGEWAQFYFYADAFKPGYNTPGHDLFITNQRIQREIARSNEQARSIGDIALHFSRDSHEIKTDSFHPTSDQKEFNNKLVGSMAELVIKKMLLPLFLDWNCRSILEPTYQRIGHLEKTGRKAGEAIPIREEVRRLSEYVRRRMREDYAQRHPPKAREPTTEARRLGRFVGRMIHRRR